MQPVVAHRIGIVFGCYNVDTNQQGAALGGDKTGHQVPKQGELILDYACNEGLKTQGESSIIQTKVVMDALQALGILQRFGFDTFIGKMEVKGIQNFK